MGLGVCGYACACVGIVPVSTSNMDSLPRHMAEVVEHAGEAEDGEGSSSSSEGDDRESRGTGSGSGSGSGSSRESKGDDGESDSAKCYPLSCAVEILADVVITIFNHAALRSAWRSAVLRSKSMLLCGLPNAPARNPKHRGALLAVI